MTRYTELLILLVVSTVVIANSSSAVADGRPNLLFIVVDDQSPFDLKVYNPASSLETPNIDRLAREGMVFDSAYHMGAWAGGVCTPSRHMIMSGRTLWHIPDKSRFGRNPNASNPRLVPPDLVLRGADDLTTAVEPPGKLALGHKPQAVVSRGRLMPWLGIPDARL